MFSNGLFVWCYADESRQKQGRDLVDRKLVKSTPPHTHTPNFIAGRPKAAILFWFFDDFRCGVPLLIVILDIKIGKNRC